MTDRMKLLTHKKKKKELSIERGFKSNKMFVSVPEAAKASALLQCLSKHLIFADVVVTD